MDSLTTCINQFLLFPHPIGVVGIMGKSGVPHIEQNGNCGKTFNIYKNANDRCIHNASKGKNAVPSEANLLIQLINVMTIIYLARMQCYFRISNNTHINTLTSRS